VTVDVFSIVPIEVWRDKRLTLEQIRVLGVLLSFRAKNTDTVWPSRQQIAERCGMNVCNISTATSSLERLGWLRKDGKGGHSKATRYTITVPDLDDSGTVAHSATPPVADSATRKEQTSEQTKEKSGRAVARPTPLPSADDRKKQPITFDTFAERKKAAGEKLIAEDDSIFTWAEGAGIPDEWLHLAWTEFANRYRGNAKRYADWPAAFRNAVRNNWFDFWRVGSDNALVLTTKGELARRAALASRRTVQEVAA
jgi:hypothetical protein